jgi:Uma2 family endonuclease
MLFMPACNARHKRSPNDAARTTAINPRVVFEVLSQSTEADDRGEKFRRYLTLESMEEYVLISQARPLVETFSRQNDGTWRFTSALGLESRVRLTSLDVDIALAEIYASIHFPPEYDQLQLF